VVYDHEVPALQDVVVAVANALDGAQVMEILHEETVALREAVLATVRYGIAGQHEIVAAEAAMNSAWKAYDRLAERRVFDL
jgi:hypothetical protein